MEIEREAEQCDGYTRVRVMGEPTLGQFLAMMQRLGADSRAWKTQRMLMDLRAIRNLTTFTEHYAIGQEAARSLGHLHRLATVVAPDRITRASEKTARQSGLNVTVFTDEDEALAWLTGP